MSCLLEAELNSRGRLKVFLTVTKQIKLNLLQGFRTVADGEIKESRHYFLL